MEAHIAQALIRLFDRHRIVFWYDTERELRADFEALALPGIEKLEVDNNEFAIKYRMLREAPDHKFLLYRDGPAPPDLGNWLLDIQLAQGEFRTSQVALWLTELGLGLEFTDVVQSHTDFFQAVRRREALHRLLTLDDTVGRIRLKMLAVCVGSDSRVDSILEQLLQGLSEGRDEKSKLISRCNLDDFLWDQLARHYGYASESPGIRDFALELFKSCFAMVTEGTSKLSGDALVFLKRWKDSRRHEMAFEILSGECAEVLGIERALDRLDFRSLMEVDHFRLVDQKIIHELVSAVANRTIAPKEVNVLVRQRRQSHWYTEFQDIYEAIYYAAQFIRTLAEATLEMSGLLEGVQKYCQSWYRLDQFYRKFVHHIRRSREASLMHRLTGQIENLYSNSFLLKVNDRWQTVVDSVTKWEAPPIPLQKSFFNRWVHPFQLKDKKVCVIISDALRYEIGDELLSLIRQEDRYVAELEPCLSMLPSYTQLGMAALLPNQKLALVDGDAGTVLVDGQSSQGIANRAKQLERALPGRASAMKAEDLMALKKDDCRALIRDNDVLYVYHNRIDATGDKRDSETRVFEAVEETLRELIRLIKKLTGANANNILVTADHGFIYQDRAIDESDFSGADSEGDQILFRDRRFVLGRGLKDQPGLRKFGAQELGLNGDLEVQLPKSINRLRLKGSGSRFVHGGASLQEVVIPVLRINKKRQSDVSLVDVHILRGAGSVITSGQLAVALYQTESVTDKVQPRLLRAGIYTLEGELVSDSHELLFDQTSENPREREVMVRFILTRKADEANGREVILRLDEKHESTTHYKEYKSLRYGVRRSFTSDFDF